MTWSLELAKLLDSPGSIDFGIGHPVVGMVLTVSPFKLSILNGKVILDEVIHDLYIGYGLAAELEKLDKVLVMPGEGGQVFFIVCKLEKIGSDL